MGTRSTSRTTSDTDEEQRSNAALIRMAGEAARIGGWAVDLQAGEVTWTEELCRIFELPPGRHREPIGAIDYYTPESLAIVRRHYAACASEGTPFDVEVEALTATGRRMWVRVIGHAIRDADGTIRRVEGATQDVDVRRRLEEELRQAQKMEAIGRLAGGIAHDFNNLLSVIVSYTSLVVDALPPGDPIREDAEQATLAAQRAAELTGQLLAFSRQKMVQPSVLAVHDIVASLEPMLRRLLAADVVITVDTRATGHALVDRAQLEQVVINLVLNARDAMPKGGQLTVETADLVVGDRGDLPPGRYVQIVVADTGTGMDAPTRARAFDPFFTTKPKGAGTGLGLSTVYGIVHQSRGHVRLASEPGVGTRVEVVLPAVEAAEPSAAPSPIAQPARGSGTVLVVEDMEQVRKAVVAVLSRAGYDVMDAAGGDAALATCAHHPGPIDLLLTDVVMPGMSGPALVARAAPLRPSMKIVFTSGHAEEELAERGAARGDVTFLPKPVRPALLLETVRRLLAGDDPRGGDGPGGSGLPPTGGRW